MINNPLSGQNARRGLLDRVRTLLTAHPRVAHFEEVTFDGMGHAVDELLGSETEIIVVNGGDGTVQAVLTALLRSPLPAALPLLAVLPGGTTNTTARNVGYGRRPLRALQGLLDDAASGRLAGTVDQRAVLRVDADADPQYAMLFGAGAVYHGVAFARREVLSRGMRGQLGAGVAVATFLSHVVAGKGGRLFPPLHAEIRIDGQAPLPPEPYFGILTSTMDRQVLGLSPYWGVGPGRLRFSALSYAPQRLSRAILPALRGRPSVHLRPDLGYRSVNADEVCLRFDSGYTLDGELFEPAGDTTRLTVSARQHAYFLRERP
ncbi:MAG: diacylglycerol kinase family protein [Candidatus Binatia bacterium]